MYIELNTEHNLGVLLRVAAGWGGVVWWGGVRMRVRVFGYGYRALIKAHSEYFS